MLVVVLVGLREELCFFHFKNLILFTSHLTLVRIL